MTNEEINKIAEEIEKRMSNAERKASKPENLFSNELCQYREHLENLQKNAMYFIAAIGVILTFVLGKSIWDFDEIVARKVSTQTEEELISVRAKLEEGIKTSVSLSVENSIPGMIKDAQKKIELGVDPYVDKQIDEATQKVQTTLDTTLIPKIDDALKKLAELQPRQLAENLLMRVRVPTGSITAYWGTTTPAGWLLCDGGEVPEGAEFDELRSMLLDGKLPDLRGMFLRGLDFGREIDLGRTLALEYQDSAIAEHNHSITIGANAGVDHARFPLPGGRYNVFEATPNRGTTGVEGAKSSHETRPINVAVAYIIKI